MSVSAVLRCSWASYRGTGMAEPETTDVTPAQGPEANGSALFSGGWQFSSMPQSQGRSAGRPLGSGGQHVTVCAQGTESPTASPQHPRQGCKHHLTPERIWWGGNPQGGRCKVTAAHPRPRSRRYLAPCSPLTALSFRRPLLPSREHRRPEENWESKGGPRPTRGAQEEVWTA